MKLLAASEQCNAADPLQPDAGEREVDSFAAKVKDGKARFDPTRFPKLMRK
jgi:hypothetical protein